MRGSPRPSRNTACKDGSTSEVTRERGGATCLRKQRVEDRCRLVPDEGDPGVPVQLHPLPRAAGLRPVHRTPRSPQTLAATPASGRPAPADAAARRRPGRRGSAAAARAREGARRGRGSALACSGESSETSGSSSATASTTFSAPW
jgi:hypothetical protein